MTLSAREDSRKPVGPRRQRQIAGVTRLISEEDAANHLGVKKSTLANWRQRGLIGYTRIGSKTFYTVAQLDQFIEACASAGSSPVIGIPKSEHSIAKNEGLVQGAPLFLKPSRVRGSKQNAALRALAALNEKTGAAV